MRFPLPPPARAAVAPVLIVTVMTAAAAYAAHVSERWLDPQSLSLFFVLPIVIAAIAYGFWASLGAALLSAVAVNFLFVEPRYTFVVAHAQDAAALALFALVGALVSAIAARARASALHAQERARIAARLQVFAADLAVSPDEDDIAAAATAAASNLAQAPAALVSARGESWGVTDAQAIDAARWAMSTRQPAQAVDDDGATLWRFWPVRFHNLTAMAVGLRTQNPPPAEIERAIEQIAAQTGVAVERVRQAQAAAQARIEAERERLKSDLLAGVSHDLRTPLSTIVFTLQSLQRFAADHPPHVRDELLALAESEARRLAKLVDELLDAARVETGALPIQMESVRARDLVETAVAEVGNGATVRVEAPPDLPLMHADRALAVRAIVSVLSNALRHGGATPVDVLAHAAGDEVIIEIEDRGPGLGPAPERLFEKFTRGADGDGRAPGLGLGLSLARSFLTAQGARIHGETRAGGGARFTLVFQRAAELTHAD